MGRVNFSSYYSDGETAEHLNMETGKKIQDSSYFSPTHVELLDNGPSWIMSHTTISAKLDQAAHRAIWEAEIFEDEGKDGVFVVVRKEGSNRRHYLRVGQNGNKRIRLSHRCSECTEAEASCYYVALAICAYESVRSGNTSVRKLVRKVMESGEPQGTYKGRQKKSFIKLLDELYYHMRYNLEMTSDLELVADRSPKRTFDANHGERLSVGESVLGKKKAKKSRARKAPRKPDWSKYLVKRELTDDEKKMVPSGVFYVDRNGEERIATEITYRKDPLLLIGPASVGKSRLARRVFEHLALPMLVISASSDRDLYDLVRSIGLKNGETVEVPAKILVAARKGYGLLIDEVASLKPDRAMFLNSILQEREIDLGTYTVRLHQDCRVIATCNQGEEYIGSIGLDPSTLDRFVPLYLDYADAKTEVEIVARESENDDRETIRGMVEVAGKTRRLYAHGEMHKPVTTRDVIRWARYSIGEDPMKIAEMLVVPAVASDEEETLAMLDLLEEVFA